MLEFPASFFQLLNHILSAKFFLSSLFILAEIINVNFQWLEVIGQL
jgi:hypothetical protein